MAQNITLQGAYYSDVPSVLLPKTGGGTASFTDVTDTTASANDVAAGKYFYTAAGVKTEGTSTGGGGTTAGTVTQDANGYLILDDDAPTVPTLITKSITANGTYNASSDSADGYSSVTVNVSGGGGLVYETGTWTPASDTSSYVIQFSNTHTTPPAYYEIVDATGTYSDTLYSFYRLIYVQWDRLFGSSAYADYDNSGTVKYGRYDLLQRVNSATTMSTQGGFINYPATETGNSTTNHPRFWATETGIKAAGYYTSYYWRTGRTYKWIAVWAPTS